MLEIDEINKICPIMSRGGEKVHCNTKCAWYANDIIPSNCVMMDISFTLCHIEKELENIYLSLPIEED